VGVVQDVRDSASAALRAAAPGTLLVMLSGGRDSVCMLDVSIALRGAGNVAALHVNYGLRTEADAEEEHCLALCERLGVELSVAHERRPERGPGGGPPGNLQAWAREARYREAERIAAASDALIATGHTASDQVETILYRLACSPGRRALLGMVASEGRLIRPLLGVTREQTGAYCEARALSWREDSSNDDELYARARVRHGLRSALAAVHPAAEANVLRTAALLREETELLAGIVEEVLGGRSSIAIERLQELPAALARLVVVRLAEEAVGDYVPQAGERVGEILVLGQRGGRAELHVGQNAGAVIERGQLTMIKLPPRGD
jgi:tRNA(Ile)-lysidine synthase